MNKLENFRFSDNRKRKQYTLIFVLISVITLSLAMLLWLGIFNLRGELVTVTLSNEKTEDTYLGAGINLDYIPNVNLIRNSSFENETNYFTYTLSDARDNSVFFEPEEIISGSIDYNNTVGNTIRVLSIGSDGVMTLKYDGIIRGFEPARLGATQKIVDNLGTWNDDPILKTAYVQSTVVAITTKGKLHTDITSNQLSDIANKEGIYFVDIASNSTTCYALTDDKVVYSSADGRSFSKLIDLNEYIGDNYILGMDANSNTLALLLSNSKVLLLSGKQVLVTDCPEYGISAICASEKEFLLCGNKTYVSGNGLVYEEIGEGGSVKSIASSKGNFYILRSDNTVDYVDRTNFTFNKNISLSEAGIVATSITATTKGQVIVSTNNNTALLLSEDGTPEMVSSENMKINRVMKAPNNELIYITDTDVYRSEVLSDFTLEDTIPENTVFPGDICVVGQTKSGVNISSEGDSWKTTDLWNIYGEGTVCQYTDDSSSGDGAVKITGTGDGIHCLSQNLYGTSKQNFVEDAFYRITFEAKGNVSKVSCWVEGKKFGKCGFWSDIRSNYNEYSYIFVVTDSMIADETVRFNISFEGEGSVTVDNIYLGLDSYSDATMPEYFRNSIIEASPSVIRLNNLNIGSNGFSESSFYGLSAVSSGSTYKGQIISDTSSLEDSLKLVKDSNASPWFVIGTTVSQADITNFLAYLCGSVSSEYGTLRINNGTALPWSRQFENIYIEIIDAENAFSGDVQRSAYVDYVISMIEKSEYYSDVKDKIVFLDGMTYDGGTMLSGADSHAMPILMENTDGLFIDSLNQLYEESNYISPRVTSPTYTGEYISSFDTVRTLSCADYLTIILSDEASFTSRHMFNLNVKFEPANYNTEDIYANKTSALNLLSTLKLLSNYGYISDLYVEAKNPLSDNPIQTSQEFLNNCGCFLFNSDDKTYLVITNTSDVQQQFLMSKGDYDFKLAVVNRYRGDGTHLTSRSFGTSGIRRTLQPGEFIVVELTPDK